MTALERRTSAPNARQSESPTAEVEKLQRLAAIFIEGAITVRDGVMRERFLKQAAYFEKLAHHAAAGGDQLARFESSPLPALWEARTTGCET
ncbi:MAG TPA: hypothetical protein VGF97_11130 [Rhizomicrobium sp.]|jgi:hypothetical protein